MLYLLKLLKNRLGNFTLLFKKSIKRHHWDQSPNHYDSKNKHTRTNQESKQSFFKQRNKKHQQRSKKITIKDISLDLLFRVLKLIKRIISTSFHYTILNRTNQLHKHIILQHSNNNKKKPNLHESQRIKRNK